MAGGLTREQLKGLPPIPEGIHRFVVARARKMSSRVGEPALETFLMVPEDTDTLGPEFVGRDVKVTMSLQAQAAFTVGNFMASLHGYEDVDAWLDGEEIEEWDPAAANPEDLISQEVLGIVSHNPYQGRMTHQIRVFKPVSA